MTLFIEVKLLEILLPGSVTPTKVFVQSLVSKAEVCWVIYLVFTL